MLPKFLSRNHKIYRKKFLNPPPPSFHSHNTKLVFTASKLVSTIHFYFFLSGFSSKCLAVASKTFYLEFICKAYFFCRKRNFSNCFPERKKVSVHQNKFDNKTVISAIGTQPRHTQKDIHF
jgi:hypothetical protein